MSIHLRGLHPVVRAAAEDALALAHHFGITPVVTSTYRSWAEQSRLYARHRRCVAQGRFPSAPDCKYPANRPGDSAHNYGLAFDSWVPARDVANWTLIRDVIGFRVPAHDAVHGEVPGWRDLLR